MTAFDFIRTGTRTIELELEAVRNLLSHLDEHFTRACELMLNCRGRVIVTGMGKSGHIGNKIAATLGQHRHSLLLCPSRRGQPRRPGHDYRQ